jgi:hypothetical protein
MKQVSKTHSQIDPRAVAVLAMTAADCADFVRLGAVGIHLTPTRVAAMAAGLGMDDTQGLVTTAGIAAPVQFLQTWLPGFVRVLTQARKIDELIGIATAGNWDDEEVVQGILEPLGAAVPYSDYGNIPLSSWNVNYERRTVLRFEQGFSVGVLEEARSARLKVSTAAEKRSAGAMALDIQRNRIGFYGYNAGNNRTYGFLNDPSLPAYQAAPNGAGGTATWATKTYLEIIADIRGMVQRLRTATGDTLDPDTAKMTLGLATNVVEYLGVTSIYGKSVRQWMRETYPGMRVVSAPELNAANGGANVAYGYPESVDDGASDDSRVWAQLVPSKFQTIGVEKNAKGYTEDYSNALAGVMCKRPYAVKRLSGI